MSLNCTIFRNLAYLRVVKNNDYVNCKAQSFKLDIFLKATNDLQMQVYNLHLLKYTYKLQMRKINCNHVFGQTIAFYITNIFFVLGDLDSNWKGVH